MMSTDDERGLNVVRARREEIIVFVCFVIQRILKEKREWEEENRTEKRKITSCGVARHIESCPFFLWLLNFFVSASSLQWKSNLKRWGGSNLHCGMYTFKTGGGGEESIWLSCQYWSSLGDCVIDNIATSPPKQTHTLHLTILHC